MTVPILGMVTSVYVLLAFIVFGFVGDMSP